MAAAAAACEDRFKFLKVGAVTDAKHDFDSTLNFADIRDTSKGLCFGHILNGLDTSSCKDEPARFTGISEDKLLESILPDTKTLDVIKEDATKEGSTSIKTKVGIPEPVDYQVKALVTDTIAETYTVDELITFLGSEDLNIVFDAASVGIPDFLNKLKASASAATKLNVNYLVNREVINDPADKVITTPKSKSASVEYTVLIDREPSDIIYDRNKPDLSSKDELQRSNFFSIYDFKLSPVGMKQNQRPGKNSMSLQVSAEIQEENGQRLFFTNDPKKENTIESVAARVQNLFRIKTAAKPPSFQKQIAAYLQSKRSGDWFQALSCLDTQRLYGDPKTGELKTVSKFITLVTHDRVLLAYALFLGVNVIFTQAAGHTLIYFQNIKTIPDISAILAEQKKRAVTYLTTADAEIAWMTEFVGWVQKLKNEYEDETEKIADNLVAKKEYLSLEYYKSLTRYMAMDIFQEYSGDDGYIATLNNMKAKADLDAEDVKIILSIKNNVGAHKQDYREEKDVKQHIESIAKNYPLESPQENVDTSVGSKSAAAIKAKEEKKEKLISMVNNFKSRLPFEIYAGFINLHIFWGRRVDFAYLNGGKFVYELLKSDVDTFLEVFKEFEAANPQGGGGVPINTPDLRVIAELSNFLAWQNREKTDTIGGGKGKKNAASAAAEPDFQAAVPPDSTLTLEPAAEDEKVTVVNPQVRRQQVIPYVNTGNECESYAGFVIASLTFDKPESMDRDHVKSVFQGGGGIMREVAELSDVVYSLLNNVYLDKVLYFLKNIDSIDNWDFEYVELFMHILREFLKEDESASQRTHLLYTFLPEFDYSKVEHPRASGLELIARHFMLRSQDKLFGEAPRFSGSKYPVEAVIERALASVAEAEKRPFEQRRDALVRYLKTQLEEIVIEGAEEPSEEVAAEMHDALEFKKRTPSFGFNENPLAPKKRNSRRRRSKGRSATRKISFNNEPSVHVY